MDVIDLRNDADASDVERYVALIGGFPLRIINHVHSGLSFVYEDGTVKLEGNGTGADVWSPLFSSPNVTAIYVNNLGSRHVVRLPPNITTLYVEDLSDVERIMPWLSGKHKNIEQRGITVRYVGNRPGSFPKMASVNASVDHLHLPLGEDLEKVVATNPWLKSVGVNLDVRKHAQVGIPCVIWSVNSHRLNHNRGDWIIEKILY